MMIDRHISTPKKPELLAPAGGPATWAAAVEAGADAVYLGLKEFSARAFAENFSMKDLYRVVDLSHERGVKVFVAFNSLIKEKELSKAASALDELTRIGPDALIIQDLGLLRLIKKYFPNFQVHASTLLAAHNLPGLQVLAGLGFDSAVLAREMTLTEIEKLTEKSPLEVEIFIHGALCFSFSGLCLMSSYLGGKGSLRGACTQPCRRIYVSGKKRGYFFSPTDLDIGTIMARIRSLPISALKIEGRMKSAEYVTRVVRAYRILLDADEDDMDRAQTEASALIEGGPSRARSTGFYESPDPAYALSPVQSATSGLFLGKIQSSDATGALVTLKNRVAVGDRLRVRLKKTDDQQAFTLKKMTARGQRVDQGATGNEVRIEAPVDISEGDLLFKVQSAESEIAAEHSPLFRAVKEPGRRQSPKQGMSPGLKRVLAELTSGNRPPRKAGDRRRPEIWYRVARTEDVSGLSALNPDRIIVPINASNVRRAVAMRRRLGQVFDRIVWAFPPLLFPNGISGFRRNLTQLETMGVGAFMLGNIGHFPLLDRERKKGRRLPQIFADYRLNSLNSQSEALLAGLGLNGLTLCIENDAENLEAMMAKPAPVDRLVYLYGRPPLFTTRFRSLSIKDNLPVESPRQERFRLRRENDYTVVFAERPVFLAPILKSNWVAGIRAFIVDLEYDPKPTITAKEIYEAIQKGRPLRSTSRFNYERGLY